MGKKRPLCIESPAEADVNVGPIRSQYNGVLAYAGVTLTSNSVVVHIAAIWPFSRPDFGILAVLNSPACQKRFSVEQKYGRNL